VARLARIAVALVLLTLPAVARADLSIGPPAAPTLPASFAGVSVETDVVTRWFPRGGCDTPAGRVLALLGRPEVRVGGNSQDRLWPSWPLPPGELHLAGPNFFHALGCVAQTGGPVVVGLNLRGNDPAAPITLLDAVRSVVPAGQLSVALGNEPNLYGKNYPTPGDYNAYIQHYTTTLGALQQRFGTALPPVTGPDAATWRWTAQTIRFITDAHPAEIDAHLYGLNGCLRTPSKPRYPTLDRLLRPSASIDLVRALAPIAAAARTAGIPAQISESNSVACRGRAGVSDTPASALWALSMLGSAATAGFGHVELHHAHAAYDAFLVHAGGRIEFRPLMSTLILADRLWPAGTRPRWVVGREADAVHAWAGQRPDGRIGVIVVNSDQLRAHAVRLASAATGARYGRLLAAGPTAVTLDGRLLTWSGGRPVWQGTRRTRALVPRGGRVQLELPPMSAAWLLLKGAAAPAGA
jgi:hypothetical protein